MNKCLRALITLTLSLGMLAALPTRASATSCEDPDSDFKPSLWRLSQGELDDQFSAHLEKYSLPTTSAPEFVSGYSFQIVSKVEQTELQDGEGFDGTRILVSGGSVAAMTDYWGEQPDEIGPTAYNQPVRWEYETREDCDSLTGPAKAPRQDVPTFVLLEADGTEHVATYPTGARLDPNDEDSYVEFEPSDAMDSLFGPAVKVERQAEAEQAALVELQQEADLLVTEFTESKRQSRRTRALVGVPLGLVAAGSGIRYWLNSRSSQAAAA